MQVKSVPKCMAEFKASPDAEGVNVIGLVSHAGLVVDEQVAKAVPDADFIISAHSHTKMFPNLLGQCLEYNTTDSTCACAPALLQSMLCTHLAAIDSAKIAAQGTTNVPE